MSENVVKEKFLQIPLQDVVSNRYQPRALFAEEELQELAQSIQEVGLLHPPLVRPLVGSKQYEIISGERRVMACRLLGHTEISVIVRTHVCNLQAAKAALIENMQRQDLNPLEIARSIKAVMQEFSLNQEELASHLGKKRSTIANYLRLLQLPKKMQESVQEGRISMAHAKVLLSCPESSRERLFVEMQQKELTVRQATKWVEELLSKKKKVVAKDVNIRALEERLQEHFGTKVSISNKSVNIHFYSLDELDHILEQLHVH